MSDAAQWAEAMRRCWAMKAKTLGLEYMPTATHVPDSPHRQGANFYLAYMGGRVQGTGSEIAQWAAHYEKLQKSIGKAMDQLPAVEGFTQVDREAPLTVADGLDAQEDRLMDFVDEQSVAQIQIKDDFIYDRSQPSRTGVYRGSFPVIYDRDTKAIAVEIVINTTSVKEHQHYVAHKLGQFTLYVSKLFVDSVKFEKFVWLTTLMKSDVYVNFELPSGIDGIQQTSFMPHVLRYLLGFRSYIFMTGSVRTTTFQPSVMSLEVVMLKSKLASKNQPLYYYLSADPSQRMWSLVNSTGHNQFILLDDVNSLLLTTPRPQLINYTSYKLDETMSKHSRTSPQIVDDLTHLIEIIQKLKKTPKVLAMTSQLQSCLQKRNFNPQINEFLNGMQAATIDYSCDLKFDEVHKDTYAKMSSDEI